jgi:DNA-directed RNA polymerase subunit RPC12/RpoP
MTNLELIAELKRKAKIYDRGATQERALGYTYAWGVYKGQYKICKYVIGVLEKQEREKVTPGYMCVFCGFEFDEPLDGIACPKCREYKGIITKEEYEKQNRENSKCVNCNNEYPDVCKYCFPK